MDQIIEKLQEAKELIQEEKQNWATRELSIALTETETAILWREKDLAERAKSNS